MTSWNILSSCLTKRRYVNKENKQRKLRKEAKQAHQQQTPPASETPEQLRLKAQREAKQKAEKEFIQKLSKLTRILGKESLPADTPVWLRLRAIISYVDADVQQLAQRADLKDMQERFFCYHGPRCHVLA